MKSSILAQYTVLALRNFSKTSSGLSRDNALRNKILSNTMITKQHMTPEISLRLITDECRLYHEAAATDSNERVFENDPFWAFYWPGGQALSRYILDHPEIVRDKSVLDVGSGSGACSIAAIMSGASYATANDIDYVASVAAQVNAELNNVTIETCDKNLIGQLCKEFEIILIGDVFYDTAIADEIIPWIVALRKNGKEILVGDPGRHGLTANNLKLMEKVVSYELPENACIENNGFKFVNVWKIK